MSWPHSGSVNDFTPANCYLDTYFKLQYPTIDSITNCLKNLGKGSLIYKVDLSRAFRQLPIDPFDYDLLCLKWKDSYFSDLFCAFGTKAGSMLCSRLTDSFRYLATQQGYTTFSYVDDVIGCGRNYAAQQGYEFLVDLLKTLNFPVSTNKLVTPTTKANCLGIIIDTCDQTVSIPDSKKDQILAKCEEVMSKNKVTRRKFQSVIGSLMFVHKCVKASRVFTNRLLGALRNQKGKFITITPEVCQDLKWFTKFIPQFNGTATYVHELPVNAQSIAIDASLQRVGGVWGSQVYTLEIPENVKSYGHICHFEMINILIALKIWAKSWEKKHINFLVDNMAVVEIMKTGYTRDPHLASYARNIWLLTACHDITISVKHIEGRKNCVADLLSRWTGHSSEVEKLCKYVENPIWCNVSQELFQVDSHI